jgi:tetratricopeptide (TPR) repeat protein
MTPRILLIEVQPPTEWARQVSEQTGATFTECPTNPAQASEDFRRACRCGITALVLASPQRVSELNTPAAAFGVPLLPVEVFDACLQQRVIEALHERPAFPVALIAELLLDAISWRPERITLAGSMPESVADVLTRRFPECLFVQGGGTKSDTAIVPQPMTEGAQSECLLKAAHSCLLSHGRLVAFFLSGVSPMATADWNDRQFGPSRDGYMPASPICGFAFDGLQALLSRTRWKTLTLKEDVLRIGALTFPGWTAVLQRAALTGGSYAQSRRARRAQAVRLNTLGEELWADGKAAAAAASFEKAVTLWNRDASIFNNLGAAYYAQHRLEEAFARFTDALHLDPRHVVARANLTMAAGILDRGSEAEKLLALFPAGDCDQKEYEQ